VNISFSIDTTYKSNTWEGGRLMDLNRANQIVESPERIKVTYQGVPVWIQTIDVGTQTAVVYNEADPDIEKTVPVSDLKEEN
jgi:small acid-soluble spore protein H (minor)